jgi:hypothetical protein
MQAIKQDIPSMLCRVGSPVGVDQLRLPEQVQIPHLEEVALMLISDISADGGLCELHAHGALIHLLLSSGHHECCSALEHKTIEQYVASLKDSGECYDCLLNVSRADHAFLLKIENNIKSGCIDLVFIDSGSRNKFDGKRAKTIRKFELQRASNLGTFLKLLDRSPNAGFFVRDLEITEKVIEKDDDLGLNRVQKIGSCSVDCWLEALRYNTKSKDTWLRLRSDLFGAIKHFFAGKAEISVDQDEKAFYERRAEIAGFKMQRRIDKIEQLLKSVELQGAPSLAKKPR